MKMEQSPTVAFVIPGTNIDPRTVLKYDPETGHFAWIVNSTRIKVGDKAGTVDSRGYIRIRIGSRKYAAHRLAWTIATGKSPGEKTIDHINGDKSDNRIANLRLATNAENQRNKGAYRCKAALPKGVFWNKDKGRFHAAIRVDRKLNHLGYFDTQEQAELAYAEAAKKLHGQFMNLGVKA